MTKVELVNRIMEVTGWTELDSVAGGVTRPSSHSIRMTIMDCVEGFSSTLLSRVKLETEIALYTSITNALTHLKAEGRE